MKNLFLQMQNLHFHYGVMDAGKTTKLLQLYYKYKTNNISTMLFLPKICNINNNKIISRIGISEIAIIFDTNFDFFQYIINNTNLQNAKMIFIDEAQFLTKQQVQQLCKITDQFGIQIYTYGLRSDFQGESFEGSKYLLLYANYIHEIQSICHCGAQATMNQRINSSGQPVKDGEQIDIGGNEKYRSVCRKHFDQ